MTDIEDGPNVIGPALHLWTIYYSPSDYPHMYVARRWELDQPTKDVKTAHTLPEIRKMIPQGMHRLPASPFDDPCIVETWI